MSSVQNVVPVVQAAPVVAPVSFPVSSLKFNQRDHKGEDVLVYELSFNILNLTNSNNEKFYYINQIHKLHTEKYKRLVFDRIKSRFNELNLLSVMRNVKFLNREDNPNIKIRYFTIIKAIENIKNEKFIKSFECSICYSDEKKQDTREYCVNNHNVNLCISCINKINLCPYCNSPKINDSQDLERLDEIEELEKKFEMNIQGGEDDDEVILSFESLLKEINSELKNNHFYNENLIYPISLKHIIEDKYKDEKISKLYIEIFESVGVELSSFILRSGDDKFLNQDFNFMSFLIEIYIDIESDSISEECNLKKLTSVYYYLYRNLKNKSHNPRIFIKPFNYNFKYGVADVFKVFALYSRMIGKKPPTYKELLDIREKLLFNVFLFDKVDITQFTKLNIKKCGLSKDKIKFKYQNKKYEYNINDYSESDINVYCIDNVNTNGKIKYNDKYDYIKINLDEDINMVYDFINDFKTNYYTYNNDIIYNIIKTLNKDKTPLKFMITSTLNYLNDSRKENEINSFYDEFFNMHSYKNYILDIMKILKYKEDTQIYFFHIYREGKSEIRFFLKFFTKENRIIFNKYFNENTNEYYGGYYRLHGFYHPNSDSDSDSDDE